MDGAADAANHLLPTWFGPGGIVGDALVGNWGPWIDPNTPILRVETPTRPTRIYVNPDYGRGIIARFVAKAHAEAQAGRASTTLLLPSTTETPWFCDFVFDNDAMAVRPGVDLTFLRGRVRFLRPDGTRAGSPGIGSLLVRFRAAGA